MSILLTSSLDSFLKLVGVLIIFVFVLVITYLTTRWMGNYQKGGGRNKNLRIVESIGIGNNKMISIVEAGTKYLVVAIGKDEVHLLTELEPEQLKDLSALQQSSGGKQMENFTEIFEKLKDKWPKKQD